MRRSGQLFRSLAILSLATIGCGHRAATTSTGASAGPPAEVTTPAAPIAGGEPAGSLHQPHAPSAAVAYLESDYPAGFLNALGRQVAMVAGESAAAKVSADAARAAFASGLGLKTGACLDLARPAGLLVGLGAVPISSPRLALFLSTKGEAAVRDDLPAPPDPRGRVHIPGMSEGGLDFTIIDVVPGGLLAVTQESYLADVREFVRGRFAAPSVPAGSADLRLVLDVSRLFKVYGPVLELSLKSLALPPGSINLVKSFLDGFGTIATVAGRYAPAGSAMVQDFEITPVPGSSFARLLAAPALVAAPDGRTLPDLPIVLTVGMLPSTIEVTGAPLFAAAGDAKATATLRELVGLMTGQFSGAFDFDPTTALRMVYESGYSDVGRARSLTRALVSSTTGILGGMAPGAGAVSSTARIEEGAERIDHIAVDRVSFDLSSMGHAPLGELLACAGHECVIAMGSRAEKDMEAVLRASADPTAGVPLAARPGIRETVAALGDVSQGFCYVDYLALGQRFDSMTERAPSRMPAASRQPGLGISWSTTPLALRVRLAFPLAPARSLKKFFGMSD